MGITGDTGHQGADNNRLTEQQVARLLLKPVNARAMVASKMARAMDSARLSGHERRLAEEFVRALARDVAVPVRAAVSFNLRHSPHLPRDLAQRLADDVDEVSLPLLAESPVLDDEILLAVLPCASAAKQEAIARRPAVSEPVSSALIEAGAENAVAALMGNHGASIGEAGLHRAVDRFPASDAVHTGIVHREALPLAVIARLVELVSDVLLTHLVANHDMPAQLASDIVLRARERTIIQFGRGAGGQDLLDLLTAMHRRQQVTTSLTVRSLCTGDMEFFETALAVLAGIVVENAKILVHDLGPLGLASLWGKAGRPASLLPSIRAAVAAADGFQPGSAGLDVKRYRASVMTRVLTQCDGLEPEDLEWMLDKLGDMFEPVMPADDDGPPVPRTP